MNTKEATRRFELLEQKSSKIPSVNELCVEFLEVIYEVDDKIDELEKDVEYKDEKIGRLEEEILDLQETIDRMNREREDA